MCLEPFQNQQKVLVFLQSANVKYLGTTELKPWLLRTQDILEPKAICFLYSLLNKGCFNLNVPVILW